MSNLLFQKPFKQLLSVILFMKYVPGLVPGREFPLIGGKSEAWRGPHTEH